MSKQQDRVNLRQGTVSKATCPDGKQQVFLRDSEQRGFALRVTAAGSKSYVYEGKLAGRNIRVTLGDPSAMTLDQARRRASEIRIMIDDGRDPRVVKAEQIAADAAKRRQTKLDATPALDAWQAYIKARAGHWSDRHKADHETMSREGGEKITRGRRAGMAAEKEPGILRPLLELPLQEITRDRVAAWLEEHAQARPTRARLAVSLLGAFLNWCSDQPDWRDRVQPDACVRMKKDLPRPKAKDDCLQREQLKPWFAAVRRIPNPVQSAYLQVALLTGARREEVASLRWEDVDFQWKSLTIRDKVEGERTIGLTPYVAALLRDLQRRQAKPIVHRLDGQDKPAEPSPWVFHSPTSATGRIQEPRISHNKALQAAGLPHLTIHGLRRSFGTLAEWVECPAGITAQIMGHRPSAIAEKHYRRRPLDLLRMWHTKIEGWILEQAGIEQPAVEAQQKSITAA
ncbi:integrase family protein [Castellaniella sp.]|uniref:tyrosine-type recombinase/integrase n=1 Tax=Castellaniella sp. TaxID=1955812 RepID=UPI002AFE96A2|nr:integrase family protein [Castellaniella sp.]